MPIGSARRRAELIALGTAVRRQRDKNGWTLDTLAEESGLSRGTIMNIEAGSHSVGVARLFELADALGVRLSLLIAQAEVDLDRQ
jgi:transcriptional regulator with XRE-family HTH domain